MARPHADDSLPGKSIGGTAACSKEKLVRRMSILGIALVAVLAITALAGAAAASAAINTTLCSTAAEPCPTANQQPPQTIEATSTNATLTTNLATVTCSSSVLKGATTASAWPRLPIEFSRFSLSGCKTTWGQTCETTETYPPGNGELAWSSPSFNGELSMAGSGIKMVCGGIINCQFSGEMKLKASANTLTATNQPRNRGSGFFCPSTATFSATYTVSTPSPFYVSYSDAGSTNFCKTATHLPLCPLPERYDETAFVAKSPELVINNPSPNSITCTEVKMQGTARTTTTEYMNIDAPVTLGGCGITKGAFCSGVYVTGPEHWVEHYQEGLGKLEGSGPMTLEFFCGTNFARYSWGNPQAVIRNGNPAQLEWGTNVFECGKASMLCTPGTLIGAPVKPFTISAPNPLYVAHW